MDLFLDKYFISGLVFGLKEEGWLGNLRWLVTESGDCDVSLCLYREYHEYDPKQILCLASEFGPLSRSEATALLKKKIQMAFLGYTTE